MQNGLHMYYVFVLHPKLVVDELNNSCKLAGVGWLSRVVFSFVIDVPNQRFLNTLID